MDANDKLKVSKAVENAMAWLEENPLAEVRAAPTYGKIHSNGICKIWYQIFKLNINTCLQIRS